MRVAVIGAGVGGLTLALALHRRGIEVSAYDRADRDVTAGNGLGLAANGMQVLDVLGPGAALRDLGAPIPSMQLRDTAGRDLTRYDLGRSGLLGVRRAYLTSALSDALPDGTVHHGHACVGVEQGERRATAVFADGARVDADVVVGADGVRSTVGARLGAPDPLQHSPRVALRGFVPGAGLPPELGRTQTAWLGADRHLLVYPVDADSLVVAGFVPDHGTGAGSLVHALRAAFPGWNEVVTALVGRAEQVGRYALADRDPAAAWSRGRVALLGDAAHPMLPHTGQGANQAIEDAAVLAALLAESPSTALDDVERALRAYQTSRRDRTRRVQLQARHNGELFSGGLVRADRPVAGPPDLSWLYDYDAVTAGRRAARELTTSS